MLTQVSFFLAGLVDVRTDDKGQVVSAHLKVQPKFEQASVVVGAEGMTQEESDALAQAGIAALLTWLQSKIPVAGHMSESTPQPVADA